MSKLFIVEQKHIGEPEHGIVMIDDEAKKDFQNNIELRA